MIEYHQPTFSGRSAFLYPKPNIRLKMLLLWQICPIRKFSIAFCRILWYYYP